MVLAEPKRKKRLVCILLIFTILFVALLARVFYLQIIEGPALQQRALSQWTMDAVIEARRGTITDRNGEILAQSGSSETVVLRPKTIADNKEFKNPADYVSRKLSEILEMSYDAVYAKASDTSKSEIWLKRQISRETANRIRELKLPGVAFYVETKRYYPNNDFLTQVLGFTSIDGVGLEGIEKYYEKYLAGKNGRISVFTDVRGNETAFGDEFYIEPVDGYTVELTIDYAIQSILEKYAEDAFDKYKPNSVMAIAMNPKTGEILGMTNQQDYDLNNIPRDDAERLAQLTRNRLLSDVNDPGSVFKVFTVAAALHEGLVSEKSTFVCNGGRHIGSSFIKCHTKHIGTLSLADALAKSCNPCFMDMALRLGKEKFYDYIFQFGFGQKTGIDFTSEASGIIMHQKYVKDADLARIGFGQSISTTSLQIMNAFCAVINGGYLMKPSLMHAVKTTDGEIVESFKPEVIRQVISEETSARMRDLLEYVVTKGSGSRAYVAGYRVGGKTGTAQKYAEDGSVKQNLHLSSFIGFAPANDPKIAVFFLIDEATDTYSDYGSVIAAPYVGQIIDESMRYLNVDPQYTQEEIEKQGGLVETPNVVGMTINEARKELNAVGLKYTLIGSENGVVYEQMPAPGVKLAKGTSIVLNIKPKEEIEPPEIVEVPNLIGKTIDECRDILEGLGLELYSHGSGTAIWQSPKPNNKVETGTTIRVEFSDE